MSPLSSLSPLSPQSYNSAYNGHVTTMTTVAIMVTAASMTPSDLMAIPNVYRHFWQWRSISDNGGPLATIAVDCRQWRSIVDIGDGCTIFAIGDRFIVDNCDTLATFLVAYVACATVDDGEVFQNLLILLGASTISKNSHVLSDNNFATLQMAPVSLVGSAT